MRDAASDVIAEWCSRDWPQDRALSRLVPELGPIQTEAEALTHSELRERLIELVTNWVDRGLSICPRMSKTSKTGILQHDRWVIQSRCPNYAEEQWSWKQSQSQWAVRPFQESRFNRYYDAVVKDKFSEVQVDFQKELIQMEKQQQEDRDAGIQILTTEITTIEQPETTEDPQWTNEDDSKWFWGPGGSLDEAIKTWTKKGLQKKLIDDYEQDGVNYDYVYDFFENLDTRVNYTPSKLLKMDWVWGNWNYVWNVRVYSHSRNRALLVNPNAVLFKKGAKLYITKLDNESKTVGESVIDLPRKATVYEVICQINFFYARENKASGGLGEAGRYYSHRWDRHYVDLSHFEKYNEELNGLATREWVLARPMAISERCQVMGSLLYLAEASLTGNNTEPSRR
ncbi:uncharacterized protein B0I36DRAFT_356770 [Microdochium trichocladiopsis]|uniref:Uncharacterized protein n=1 Tax=Microdochium trichocladiopsis TaxID=1682393 RepID=A0A9P8XR26_9PEZI|nr:uncharacterized protein B0I36DRAFT_356770 [Microdochium trichocladiopsis]KAH7009287.1 hypothetical protein B0I36DRAFT_356770 [Microdochium trichocladiopsis]